MVAEPQVTLSVVILEKSDAMILLEVVVASGVLSKCEGYFVPTCLLKSYGSKGVHDAVTFLADAEEQHLSCIRVGLDLSGIVFISGLTKDKARQKK